jgi:bilirubin oxidase
VFCIPSGICLTPYSMLVAFNITQLANWGYDNSTLFIDPMQPEFRPKDYNEADYTDEAIDKKLAWFYSTNAYNHGDVKAVYSCLDAYASGVNCTQTSTRSTSTRRTPTRSTSIRSTLAPSTFRTVTGLTTVITPTLSSFSGNAMLRSSSSAWNTYGAKSGYGPVTGS